ARADSTVAAGSSGQGGTQNRTSTMWCAAGVPVTKTGAACAGTLLGDADCSGAIDIVDALIVARYAKQMAVQTISAEAGDVNCDGCLTEEDANRISEYGVVSYTPFVCP
ncbi:MAG TPA: dockerin type I domain-containing protein, partial [Polyangiaceae bacterium]